ncbi:MAG TPA: hypothetical protein VFP87_14165 [Chitinophagaceae bacterium]|nr:hypothetical protein [Chitinophagaceae bacterium]
MKTAAILLLAFTLCSTASWTQNITSKKTIVQNAISRGTDQGTDLPFFSTPADAEKIISNIMGAMGLESTFRVREAHVPNVEAKIRHRERYILYNPGFINQVNEATRNKWASIFILAHEVGHHLEGHTLLDISSRPDIELEADEFAGFALCKMGATLQQAQLAMYYISTAAPSKTHPGRADRLAAIEKGWDKAESQMTGVGYDSAASILNANQN